MKKILLPLVVAAIAAPGYAQNARSPQQLDAGLGKPLGPSVSTSGDLTATMWKEDGTNNMYAAVSTDNGNSWGTAVRIDSDLTAASKFANDLGLVVSGGNIYAVWSDDRVLASDAEAMFTMSSDGGTTWQPDMGLPKGYPSGGNDLKAWKLMADGNTVVMVCATENDGGGAQEELFVTVSIDAGANWAAAVPASTHPNGTVDVDLMSAALANGVVHMVWQDNTSGTNEAFYSSYDIGTSTMTAQDVLVSAGLAGGTVENDIFIAANGNTVAIGMQADNLPTSSAHQLNINVSTDGGATWGGDVQVGSYVVGTDDTDHPVLAVTSAGNVIAACEDNRNGTDEMFAYTSTDGGVTWTEAGPFGGGGFPSIGGNGDYVAINWTGPSYPEGSMVVASSDGGVNWGAPLDLAAGQINDADYAEIAFNDKYANFVAVWLDDSATGTNEMFAGGFRSQGLTGNGPFSAGLPVNFSGAGWGVSEAGNSFMVLVSTTSGYGSAFLPGDGRDLGVGVSPVLITTSTMPSLQGTIAPDGSASTPVLTMPGRFPLGTMLYTVAVSRGGGSFGSITDSLTITVE
ncbi:MAG: hypothetical protein GY747_08590 [Planctomycetes bacterium]|nr:hypothetical protein [Planctomycetota bacterium]MCP4771242.1 hypothetical protein [Planctomycetota bacterium]MCP4862031.1 hypothetical protein [Planctomycetota bacterium]